MQSETSRIEAFSDGVFAIAITLLILEIKIPSPQQGSLRVALGQQWPSYMAFLLSFVYIGVMWINHHRMFIHIRKSNEGLMILNVLLLLGVTAVPFPTAVLAAHLSHPERRTAALIYNATFVAIALLFNLLWRYAVSHNLVDKNLSASAEQISRQYAVGPLLYLGCMALAWINVPVSVAANIALALYFALPPSLMKKRSTFPNS